LAPGINLERPPRGPIYKCAAARSAQTPGPPLDETLPQIGLHPMHGISRLDAPAQALTQENFLDAALPIPRQLILRDYQSDLLHSLPYGPGNRTLMQLATGAGKTEIAMTWARLRNPTPARPLWFVVHTIELLRQTFWRFVRAGFDPGKLCFGEGEDGSKSIHICTIQTLTARQRRGVDFTPPAFIILDEAHHSAGCLTK
jgi:superfamily II DNA or RNA helicase